MMYLVVLSALTIVAGFSLALSLILYRRYQRLLRLVLRSVKLTYTLSKSHRFIWRALSKALASYEAEDALERLRRKRRRRYIAFIVVTEDGKPPQPHEIEKAIVDAVRRLAGDLAVADARPQLVYYDPLNGAGVISASHTTKYIVLAALGLVRRLDGKKAVIIPLRTSGTIKRARKALPKWK